MELLIGRDPEQNQLAVIADGKPYRLDVGGKVPNTVSRYKPAEHTVHCRILLDGEKGMRFENLNPQNESYVNGQMVERCRVLPESRIELGPDLYAINLQQIIKFVGYRPEYSIKHLSAVWREYDEALLNLQLEQQKKQNQQRLQGIISQLSMLCVIIPSVLPIIQIPSWLRAVLVIAAISMAGYFYWKGTRPDETFVMKKRNLDKEFKKKYICPNPKCKHFLGFIAYDTLQYKKGCSDCSCNYKC